MAQSSRRETASPPPACSTALPPSPTHVVPGVRLHAERHPIGGTNQASEASLSLVDMATRRGRRVTVDRPSGLPALPREGCSARLRGCARKARSRRRLQSRPRGEFVSGRGARVRRFGGIDVLPDVGAEYPQKRAHYLRMSAESMEFDNEMFETLSSASQRWSTHEHVRVSRDNPCHSPRRTHVRRVGTTLELARGASQG